MIIYKITNKVNGKIYIGKTKRTLEERWKQHYRDVNSKISCFKLQKAIKEFGVENFIAEEIDSAGTNEEANEKEVYWIKFYNSMNNGYNTSPGGKAGGHRRKVQAVEDKIIFDTMVDAAKHYGISISLISFVVNKEHLKAGGQHWISL